MSLNNPSALDGALAAKMASGVASASSAHSSSSNQHFGGLQVPLSHLSLGEHDNSSSKLNSAGSPPSEAWFVPDPDDVPPTEPPSLHDFLPVLISAPPTSSTLPGAHVPGVRPIPTSVSTSPSSSAWGSTMADTDSVGHGSTLSSSPISPSGSSSALSIPKRDRSGSGWSSAVPHDLLSSPRGHFSSGELDPLSSPRVSAHRVSLNNSPNPSSYSPLSAPMSFGSPRGGGGGGGGGLLHSTLPSALPPSSPSSDPADRRVPTLPTRTVAAATRDSYETTDGSSSHVSGSLSFTSHATVITEDSDEESDESSHSGNDHRYPRGRFGAAQGGPADPPVVIGSVPTPSSIVSPRSASSEQAHGSLKTSNGTSPRTTTSGPGVARIPRTKSVVLNPMLAGRVSSNAINVPSSSSIVSSSASPASTPTSTTMPTTGGGGQSHSSQVPSSYIIDRRTSSSHTLRSLQAIPEPIAAALNLVNSSPEMRTGGDTHIHQWAWDLRKKHPFLKISSDQSSLSWSSATNYGLSRGNAPLRHKKTFIELAKTRGVSQLLQIGLAKSTVDWSCSPEKMQFNSVKIGGEWTAIWVKSSTTGDRFGVLFDLENHKLTIYRNGIVAYTHDIPATFQVVEETSTYDDTTATNAVAAAAANSSNEEEEAPSITSSSAPSINEADAIYPFIGVCGDQDILITEAPEFEKYVEIAWAHHRKTQIWAPSEVLEGVPAILEVLGLQKLRPKFEGMNMTSFQKLKDADLRKLGATTEQRRRLLSQIETMK
jgi:hypothetical protein